MSNNIISFKPKSITKNISIKNVYANKNIINMSTTNSNFDYQRSNSVEEINYEDLTLNETTKEENVVNDMICSTGNFEDFTDYQNVTVNYVAYLWKYEKELTKYTFNVYGEDGSIINKKYTINEIYKDLDNKYKSRKEEIKTKLEENNKIIDKYINRINEQKAELGFYERIMEDINFEKELKYLKTLDKEFTRLIDYGFGDLVLIDIHKGPYECYTVVLKDPKGDYLILNTPTEESRITDILYDCYPILQLIENYELTNINITDAMEILKLFGLESYISEIKTEGVETLQDLIILSKENYNSQNKHVLEEYKYYASLAEIDDLKDGTLDNDIKVNIVGYSKGGNLASYVYKNIIKLEDNDKITEEEQKLINRLGGLSLFNAYTANLSELEAKELANDQDVKYYANQGDGVSAVFNYDIFSESDNFHLIYTGDEDGNPWYSSIKHDNLININIKNIFTGYHYISPGFKNGFDKNTGEVLKEIELDTGTVSVEKQNSKFILKKLIGTDLNYILITIATLLNTIELRYRYNEHKRRYNIL